MAIKGVHDYAITDSKNSDVPNTSTIETEKTPPSQKFSDSTNSLFNSDSLYKNVLSYLEDGVELNDNVWTTISEEKFVSMADLYLETGSGIYQTINKQKDYHNLYETSSVNSGIFNSSIYRIQAKYTDYNLDGTFTNNDTTKLYNGSTAKRLLLKIIYTLKSDIDNPKTHTFNSATNLEGTITTEGIQFPSDTEGGYHYIPGNNDYFKIVVNNTKKVKVELYDYLREATNTRKKYALKFAIYKEELVGTTITRNLYKDFTTIDNTYSYPSQIIENTVFGDAVGEDITYYIVVNGSIKAYYYGVKLSLETADISTDNINQVLQFNISDVVYDNLSTNNINSLKTEITNALIEASEATEDLTLTTNDFYLITITASSGDTGIIATIYFKTSINETEAVALKNTLNSGSYTITVTVGSEDTTKTISSVNNSSIASEDLPSTGDGGDDGSGGGGGGDITGPGIIEDGINITSSPAGENTYFNNEIITVNVVMNEKSIVDISGGTPYLNLVIGSNTRQANFTSISEDGLTLTFSYTVASDDLDTNGISINANPINLNDGTIKDAAGNNATLIFSAIGDNTSHKVGNSKVFLEKSGFLTGNIHDIDRNTNATLDILASNYIVNNSISYYCFINILFH